MNTEALLEQILSTFSGLLPDILLAILVLFLGMFLAKIIRKGVSKLIEKTKIQSTLDEKTKNRAPNIARFISSFVYYIILLYTLMLVLDIMGIKQVLQPLVDMFNEFLIFIPNLVAAGLILYVGYILSKLIASAINLLATPIQTFSDQIGFKSNIDLVKILSSIVFLFIFIPIAIIAIDTLHINVISEPASLLLGSLLSAIPQIIAAIVILIVFAIGGKFVANILNNLLDNFNLDGYAEKLSIKAFLDEKKSVSKIISNLVFFFIVFIGVISAVEKLELISLQSTLEYLLELSGSILLGMVILIVGNALAQKVYKVIITGSESNTWMANLARVAILGLFIPIALNTIGIGEEIVNLAFLLILGAISVAIALSFGLGGKEPAKKVLDKWIDKTDDK